jgi:hypothetical protein
LFGESRKAQTAATTAFFVFTFFACIHGARRSPPPFYPLSLLLLFHLYRGALFLPSSLFSRVKATSVLMVGLWWGLGSTLPFLQLIVDREPESDDDDDGNKKQLRVFCWQKLKATTVSKKN